MTSGRDLRVLRKHLLLVVRLAVQNAFRLRVVVQPVNKMPLPVTLHTSTCRLIRQFTKKSSARTENLCTLYIVLPCAVVRHFPVLHFQRSRNYDFALKFASVGIYATDFGIFVRTFYDEDNFLSS